MMLAGTLRTGDVEGMEPENIWAFKSWCLDDYVMGQLKEQKSMDQGVF